MPKLHSCQRERLSEALHFSPDNRIVKCLSAWLCRQAIDERLHAPAVWMLHAGKRAEVYRSVHHAHELMELQEYVKDGVQPTA